MKRRKIVQWFCLLALMSGFCVFLLFVYGQFQMATMQTLTNFNSDFVERVETVSVSMLNNIKTSAMQMFYTSSIKTLRTKRTLSNAEQVNGLRDLGNFVGSSDFLESVMVYNSKLDMVFTSESVYPSALSADFHDAEAAAILRQPEDYPYLVPIRRGSGSGTTYSFLFFEYKGTDKSTLLLNITEEWYQTQLLGMSRTGDSVIMGAGGELLAVSDTQIAAQALEDRERLFSAISRNPEEGFLLPSFLTADPGWMYCRMTLADGYYIKPLYLEAAAPGLIHIRKFIISVVAMVVGAAILLIGFLFVRVYLPFHDIRRLLGQSGGNLQNVSTHVETLVERQKESDLKQQLANVRQGGIPHNCAPPLVLMMAGREDAEVFKALGRDWGPGALVAELENEVRMLAASCAEEQKRQLCQCFAAKSEAVLYVSRLCYTGEEAARSYQELEELRALRPLYPDRKVLDQEIIAGCNRVSAFNPKQAAAVVNALKAEQYNAAMENWIEIFALIRQDRYADFRFAVRYVNKQLRKLLADAGADTTAVTDDILDGLERVEDLHTYMSRQFAAVIRAVGQKKQEQRQALAVQVDEFISRHYLEVSFSPQQVAEAFQMNTAYLGRQYHQVALMSISDAIHRARIGRARQLLDETELLVETVAREVGYGNNEKYFFVLFKKWTGYTPKAYRHREGLALTGAMTEGQE